MASPTDKKKALGRGIKALLGESYRVEPSIAKGGYTLYPIGAVSPSAFQPRRRFDNEKLDELAESIRENGIIEPLIVRKNSNGVELIAGERRLRAALRAGLKEVPVIIREATDAECLELAIIENIQRQELNPIEEADGYRNLIGFGLTQEQVAKKVGKDRATVANYMRLLKLPPEVKDELAKGTISMGHARAILAVEGHGRQSELCRRIITKGLSVREAESLGVSVPKKPKAAPKGGYTPIENELIAVFGTKVVLSDKRGKGKVEIHFFSEDERERVLDMLKNSGGR